VFSTRTAYPESNGKRITRAMALASSGVTWITSDYHCLSSDLLAAILLHLHLGFSAGPLRPSELSGDFFHTATFEMVGGIGGSTLRGDLDVKWRRGVRIVGETGGFCLRQRRYHAFSKTWKWLPSVRRGLAVFRAVCLEHGLRAKGRQN
jgi:hypothetical protein